MSISLRRKLALILHLLKDKAILLCTPFAHIIPSEWNFKTACDSCKEGNCGWGAKLPFRWHLEYRREVVQCTYIPNNKYGRLVSIILFEFFLRDCDFVAAIYALTSRHATIGGVYWHMLIYLTACEPTTSAKIH